MYYLQTLKTIFSTEVAKQKLQAEDIKPQEKISENKKVYKTHPSTQNDFKKQNSAGPTKEGNTDTCFPVFVIDGDSFKGMHMGKQKVFRLADIDCPEYNQPGGKEAKNFLYNYFKDLKSQKKGVIFLDFKGMDKHDRHIVEVFEDKEKTQSLNKKMLEKGLATSERYKNNAGEHTNNLLNHIHDKVIETGAKLQNKGVWEEPANKPIKRRLVFKK